MTTVVRRQGAPNDLVDWMSRFFDDRLLTERFGATDRDAIRIEQLTRDGTLVVRAEMPGIDPEKDVTISIHDGLLHLRVERQAKEEHTTSGGYRSEFTYGMFERTLTLPAGVTGEDVQATYKDGILEVSVPLPKAPASATVPVVRLP